MTDAERRVEIVFEKLARAQFVRPSPTSPNRFVRHAPMYISAVQNNKAVTQQHLTNVLLRFDVLKRF